MEELKDISSAEIGDIDEKPTAMAQEVFIRPTADTKTPWGHTDFKTSLCDVNSMKSQLEGMEKNELIDFIEKWAKFDNVSNEIQSIQIKKKNLNTTLDVLKRESEWKRDLAFKSRNMGTGSYEEAEENIQKSIKILHEQTEKLEKDI